MNNGNWNGGVAGGYVTKEELKQELIRFAAEIGKAMAEDRKESVKQVNLVTKAFNALKEELGGAQNETAEIVDALVLHLEACMEKLGLSIQDEMGRTEVTQEFKDWCAARIDKAELFKKAEKAGIN